MCEDAGLAVIASRARHPHLAQLCFVLGLDNFVGSKGFSLASVEHQPAAGTFGTFASALSLHGAVAVAATAEHRRPIESVSSGY